MRHIVSPDEISPLLERRQRCPHPSLDIQDRVVPSCLPRNLECRTADPGPLPGHALHSRPNLLNLADAELRLIEQDKMLVEVRVAVKHITLGFEAGVTPCPARLLHVILQRSGDIVMHDEPHVALVDSHAESRGGDDDPDFPAHKCLLVEHLLVRLHLAVERQRAVAVARELGREVACSPGPRDIHDCGACMLFDEVSQLCIFLLVGVGVND